MTFLFFSFSLLLFNFVNLLLCLSNFFFSSFFFVVRFFRSCFFFFWSVLFSTFLSTSWPRTGIVSKPKEKTSNKAQRANIDRVFITNSSCKSGRKMVGNWSGSYQNRPPNIECLGWKAKCTQQSRSDNDGASALFVRFVLGKFGAIVTKKRGLIRVV